MKSLEPTSLTQNTNLFFFFLMLDCSVRFFATPLDYSPPGSSVHGILQARILEWVAPFPSPGDLPDSGEKFF